MAINALQVAWISRLADKGIVRPGASIVEFSPQDLACSRRALERYASRHCSPGQLPARMTELFDGEHPRPVKPDAFYAIFGTGKYRSVDLLDPRADWLRDLNLPLRLPKTFDLATNFGTAEHVFNIGAVFRSIHLALRAGGVALHVLPAFGDIDHGFFNIHPTLYLDLAAANDYTIEDFCYVDRWDIRNKVFEADPGADIDFDALPIRMEHLRNREVLQRLVTTRFIENAARADTQLHGPAFPGLLYDYCLVALRKVHARPFRYPTQGIYGGGAVHEHTLWPPPRLVAKTGAMVRKTMRRIPLARRAWHWWKTLPR